ncbi:hypothetical protein [Marinobacterium aestuariivivens]|uniref:Ubiquitin carboxyl-hydrolase n=1 Tax=Marinobacterium aestuariivivens TaxID=1698799 RepID=A0ABW1ZZ70_9GAMM
MSRPSSYESALGNKICERLAAGESLRSICADSDMPSKSTVLLWIVDGRHKEFSDQYRLAREAAGYAHADRLVELVDKLEAGEIEASVARAMADNLKWCAERMAPKAYSSRQEVQHSGSVSMPHEQALALLQ